MIDFTDFRADSGSPIYLQIVKYFKKQVAAGVISNGDEMISRRALSALLGINPNTVQKAYALLEAEGLIQSHSGAVSCAVVSPSAVASMRSELLEDEVGNVVKTLKQIGLDKNEALNLIERTWEK